MLVDAEGRNRQDIDLIISRQDLAKLPEIKTEDDNNGDWHIATGPGLGGFQRT